MYELSQAELIAHDSLVQNLAPYAYHPSNKTPVLWTHYSRRINSTLVVNDFRVKYSEEKHAPNLKAALEHKYNVTTD